MAWLVFTALCIPHGVALAAMRRRRPRSRNRPPPRPRPTPRTGRLRPSPGHAAPKADSAQRTRPGLAAQGRREVCTRCHDESEAYPVLCHRQDPARNGGRQPARPPAPAATARAGRHVENQRKEGEKDRPKPDRTFDGPLRGLLLGRAWPSPAGHGPECRQAQHRARGRAQRALPDLPPGRQAHPLARQQHETRDVACTTATRCTCSTTACATG
jgi:hypothetical protein